MADVQFEEDNQFSTGGGLQSRRNLGVPTTPGMVRLLAKIGVRDEKFAGYVLIVFAAVTFAVSFFIFARTFRSDPADSSANQVRVGPSGGEL